MQFQYLKKILPYNHNIPTNIWKQMYISEWFSYIPAKIRTNVCLYDTYMHLHDICVCLCDLENLSSHYCPQVLLPHGSFWSSSFVWETIIAICTMSHDNVVYFLTLLSLSHLSLTHFSHCDSLYKYPLSTLWSHTSSQAFPRLLPRSYPHLEVLIPCCGSLV